MITQQREIIANALGAKTEEIYFTAGGSESDNWALKATAEAYGNKGKHIITTKIEHHAILHSAKYLEKRGYEVTYLDVDEYGVVKLDDLKAAIRPDTILISVMFANNEIGTIQPIKEIGEIAHEHGILFHTCLLYTSESRKERKSRREIYMQLVGKGVSRELIDEAFEESYEREDSTEAIRRLLEKKHYDRENTTPEEKKKIMAYLVRKGFGYDDIRRTMQIYKCEMYS